MQDRFKYRFFDVENKKMYDVKNICFVGEPTVTVDYKPVIKKQIYKGYLIQCTGLKDKNGKLIYEGDIIVISNQYPFYDYKNKEDMKQDLNSTEGEIKGESILNYIGIVEWIYSQWQYVYHCVNPKKQGISEGVNQGLNDFGFDETENTCYEVIGNIYENPELIKDGE